MTEMPEQHPLNPDELARQLDAWLEDNAVPDTTEPLLETAMRLHQAPRPALNPDAFARIQQRVLEAAPHNTAASIAQGQQLARWVGMAIVGFIIVLLVVLVVWAAQVMTPDTDASLPEMPPASTQEPEARATEELRVSATATIILTNTPIATSTFTATATVNRTPITSVRTIMPSPTNTPTLTDPATALPVLVVTAAPIKPPTTTVDNTDGNGASGTGTTSDTNGSGGSSGETTPNTTTNADTVDWDNQPCDNPPPPWAPANGWRRRCGGEPSGSNPGGNQPGNGNSGNNNGNGGGGNNGNGNGNGGGKGK